MSSITGRSFSDGRLPFFEPGKRFSRFRIVERIGGGGMGDVYKEEDGGGVIALKILKPSDEGHQQSVLRFERELVLARRVKHPNVLRCARDGRCRWRPLHLYGLTFTVKTCANSSRPLKGSRGVTSSE